MGTSVIGNLDSQVWKMLGIDTEEIDDKNKDENNRTLNKDEDKNKKQKENKRHMEEERLRRD